MKKGQNYYKRMAVDAILDNMGINSLVELYNKMQEDKNALPVFENTDYDISNNMCGHSHYDVLVAATKGCWIEGDDYAYINESSRGTELHSFSRLIDKDCPIYLSEIADWLERNDWEPLRDTFAYNEYEESPYEVENAFRMFAEEDEGFSPVGIGIYIGEHGGIDLYENWDNCIIYMYER